MVTNPAGPPPSNPKANKPKTWSAKDALRISFLAYVVSQVFVIIPVLLLTLIYGEQAAETSFLNQPWVSLVLTGVSATGLLATLLLFLRYKHISPKALGLTKPKLKSIALVPGVYLVYLLILIAAVAVTGALFTDFNIDQAQEIGFENAAGWQLLLAFLGLVVIAPFAEELMFRGFIYKGISRPDNSIFSIIRIIIISIVIGYLELSMISTILLAITYLISEIFIKQAKKDNLNWPDIVIFQILGLVIGFGLSGFASLVMVVMLGLSLIFMKINRKMGAAILTSTLFGLVHLQWNVAIDTFILSLALIWLVEKTNNIWPAIALHALKNGIAFVGIFVLAID